MTRHPEHQLGIGAKRKIVLVTIFQGWNDPPFLVSVLHYLGVALYNAERHSCVGAVKVMVVVHRPLIEIDEETVWHTRLLVRTFLWIRKHVQTLPEHLGVPPSATTYVTLQIDLRGEQGGEPLRTRAMRRLRWPALRFLARLPKKPVRLIFPRQTNTA